MDLERAEVRRYTDADQQAEYPGDRFFEFVPALMDDKMLRKHFRPELDRGKVEANLKVAQSLFQLATSGRNVAAAIFWMKDRAGWREKHDVEVSGKDGAPLAPTFIIDRRIIDPMNPGSAHPIIDGSLAPAELQEPGAED